MKHINAFIIKLIMLTAILEFCLNILTELNFVRILYISALVTVIAYNIGDLLILPMSNNIIATVADIGILFVSIYMFNYLWNYNELSFLNSFIAAVIGAIGEWFFHKYVINYVFHEIKEL